jgi:hypothetical protein
LYIVIAGNRIKIVWQFSKENGRGPAMFSADPPGEHSYADGSGETLHPVMATAGLAARFSKRGHGVKVTVG